MGSPRRFFGTGEPELVDGITIPGRCAVEVTFRTHQQRHLLRPDAEATRTLAGCFGRAYHRYPELNLHVLSVLSNHGCFLATPDSAFVLSSFMRDFLADAAKKLNLERGRDGTFWERRYRAIPVTDEAAMDERFAYVLTQGTKENLVWSARDWPGLSSTKALLGGPELVGHWRDRSAESALARQRTRKLQRAAARGATLDLPRAPQVWRRYPIPLVPMRHWQHLKVGQRRARVAQILRRDDDETRRRHARDGTAPLGTDAVCRTNPFSRPATPARRPAPLCHASTRPRRQAYRALYNAFRDQLHACRTRAEDQLPALGARVDTTLPPLCRRPPMGPRRPQPPPVLVHAEGPPRRREPRATSPPAG